MTRVTVPAAIVDATLRELRSAGAEMKERLVLWVGSAGTHPRVTKMFVPHQVAELDFFHVPPRGMREVFDAIRPDRLAVLAQVHSHPEEAFHSAADDRWAVVRHAGALSIVVPWFAASTTGGSFLRDVAVFSLSLNDAWEEVPGSQLPAIVWIEKT